MSQGQVEQFTREQFESALTAMSTKGKLWTEPVIVKREYVYTIPVAKTNMRLVIRSSIDPQTGQARASGQDSIRVRVQYQSNGSWREFGKIKKSHVKRLTGWQGRLKSMLRDTYALAAEKHNARLSAVSSAAKAVTPVTTTKPAHTLGKPAVTKPACPKCGAPMVLRTAKRGSNRGNQFWGCSKYFATKCRGSLPYPLPTAASEHTPAPAPKLDWKPTPQQQKIFDFITNSTLNAVIEAVAGAGKTTTIVKALELLDSTLKIAFLAFNVKIKNELAKRAPAFVHVSTLNSLGNGNVREALSGARFDEYKLLNIVDDLADQTDTNDEYNKVKGLKGTVVKLVNLCKANLESPSYQVLEQICDKYGIDIEDDDKDLVTLLVKRVLALSVADAHSYDYGDQIYWSAKGTHGVVCKTFDVVFVDEAQDLNKAQIAMLLKTVKTGGRVIAVGDRYQSIYGFRGADIEAIPNLIKALNATTLPLSLTFRCPKSHVKLAQELVPHIQALPTAAEGVLDYITGYQALSMYTPGDLVLCRCNAPLVKPAMALIRRGIKAVILGRDIGSNLVALIDKVEQKTREHTLDGLLFELEQYCNKQARKLTKRGKGNQAQVLEDKVETIIALSEDCDTVRQLKAKIDQVFSDTEQGVVFSSVHKAKGTEAPRVFVLKINLMPHPKATTDWQLEQERNIKYVALTRSKAELYLINEPKDKAA